jgi:hypothetical protein
MKQTLDLMERPSPNLPHLLERLTEQRKARIAAGCPSVSDQTEGIGHAKHQHEQQQRRIVNSVNAAPVTSTTTATVQTGIPVSKPEPRYTATELLGLQKLADGSVNVISSTTVGQASRLLRRNQVTR